MDNNDESGLPGQGGRSDEAGLGEADSSRRSPPGMSRSVQAQLGQRLRHFYESLALGETPVPDRFIDLLDRLEKLGGEKKLS